jgi:DcuC family C4-dicarboxylate transporter
VLAAFAIPIVPATVVVLVVGGIALAKRYDIRLVLIAAAAALFLVRATQPEVAGQRLNAFVQLFVEFVSGMTRPSAVVPICSAMGFAYVCKLTGCDAHLVHLLIRPLRHIKWLLIPGGIAVAFFVNSAIVSQTSTVSVVGPVIIPLLMAAGISRVTAGSLLLLGGSMGGELLNPAAVEVTAIKLQTGRAATDIIAHLLPYNLLASGTALVVFWMLAFYYERRHAIAIESAGVGGEESLDVAASAEPGSIAATMSKSLAESIDRVDVFKAAVPLIPIFLLMVVKRVLEAYGWMPAAFITSDANRIGEQTVIATAMLMGVLCAGLASPRQAERLPAAFFEGAGFAYAHVISIITAASMFAEGVRINGLIDLMTAHLRHAPTAVTIASIVIPWAFACVTGTAVGTAPLVINILLPIAMGGVEGGARSAAGIATGVRVGTLNAIAAQFGRTSSPVAPVTIMCATLARARPLDLVKRVAPPLLAGGIVLLIAALWAA